MAFFTANTSNNYALVAGPHTVLILSNFNIVFSLSFNLNKIAATAFSRLHPAFDAIANLNLKSFL